MLLKDKESAKKELLLLLGRKFYSGLANEKITVVSDPGAKDFGPELERVTTLIDYVKNKQKELRPEAKEIDKSSRNKRLRE